MAVWQITISGKGIRQAGVEAVVNKLKDKYGEGATVTVRDASPPESRAARFAAAMDQVSDARSEVEGLRDELQEWMDNLPENLQSGGKAGEIQEAIDALEEVVGEAEELEGMEVSFPGMY